MLLKKTFVVAFVITLISLKAFALTDRQALELGMMPFEDYMIAEMKAITTPGLNSEGVARAIQTHRLVIAINKSIKGPSAQTLKMYENGTEILSAKVSTGRERTEHSSSGRIYLSTTPKGYFRPTKIYTDYLSYTWNSPMPNAVFFIGGIAIHATSESAYKQLGTRASGGCIRTKLGVSKLIREKIMETGMGSEEGQYKIVKEAKGRNRVSANSVIVDKVNRYSGEIENSKVLSWDTVVIVYEE